MPQFLQVIALLGLFLFINLFSSVRQANKLPAFKPRVPCHSLYKSTYSL